MQTPIEQQIELNEKKETTTKSKPLSVNQVEFPERKIQDFKIGDNDEKENLRLNDKQWSSEQEKLFKLEKEISSAKLEAETHKNGQVTQSFEEFKSKTISHFRFTESFIKSLIQQVDEAVESISPGTISAQTENTTTDDVDFFEAEKQNFVFLQQNLFLLLNHFEKIKREKKSLQLQIQQPEQMQSDHNIIKDGNQLNKSISQFETVNEQLMDAVEELAEKKAEAEVSRSIWERQSEESATLYEKEIQQLREEVKHLHERIQTQDTVIDNTNESLYSITHKNEHLNAQIQRLESEKSKLEHDVTSLRASILAQPHRFGSFSTQSQQPQQILTKMRSATVSQPNLQSQVENLKFEVKNLQESLANEREKCAKLDLELLNFKSGQDTALSTSIYSTSVAPKMESQSNLYENSSENNEIEHKHTYQNQEFNSTIEDANFNSVKEYEQQPKDSTNFNINNNSPIDGKSQERFIEKDRKILDSLTASPGGLYQETKQLPKHQFNLESEYVSFIPLPAIPPTVVVANVAATSSLKTNYIPSYDAKRVWEYRPQTPLPLPKKYASKRGLNPPVSASNTTTHTSTVSTTRGDGMRKHFESPDHT